ncbi:MAG: rhomboid family intramembrane serine protease [Firmicutes bacterium]|nr:rhomboid family intramembrane serine protease [Bacillota bacterium]
MIPLRDNIRSRRFPFLTVTILVTNVAVFFYELSLGDSVQILFRSYGVIPRELTGAVVDMGPDSLRVLATLVSSQFLHVGWFHLLGNLLYLWIFADNVEGYIGSFRFFILYLLSGVTAAAVHVAIRPLDIIPTIGASGAIAGVLGAYVLLFPWAKVKTLVPIGFFLTVVEIPALLFLGLWFVIQFLSGLAALAPGNVAAGGVAWWAHVGGFVGGAVLLMILKPARAVSPSS